MLPPGQENAALIINFKGTGGGKIPTVAQARAVLNILQTHNPERLGKALISELPWYVNTFFKLISPFIDPVTREKMNFQPDVRKFVPPGNLWRLHEGDLEFVYDHRVYWKGLEEVVGRKREAYRERWVRGGKRMGEYEEYLRGGERVCLQRELDGLEGGQADGGADSELSNGVKKMSVSG